MNTKSKTILIAAGTLVAGYALGVIFGIPETDNSYSSGDITKVNKSQKTVVASQPSALEERLKNDTIAFNEESVKVELINSRITDFADLVEVSIKVASDKTDFGEEINSLIKVRELSKNAVQAGKVASASLEYLSSGQGNELVTDYEQAYHNLVVAFMIVDRQVQLGEQFVVAADKYLKGKSLEEVPDIALLRDMWVRYCTKSAILSGDSRDVAYWNAQKSLCNQDILGKCSEEVLNAEWRFSNRDRFFKLAWELADLRFEPLLYSSIFYMTGEGNLVEGRTSVEGHPMWF